MIPNNLSVAVVDNHLGGRQIAMKIDTDSTVHLMSLLTDMYSDPEAACLREYSTNADDSHKDAGQTRPIEVTTPTSLSPYLRIKDYGLGMDGGTIEDIYSQYGRSTKRTQTNTNGSMGIGGKSALAYTNQFSVIGIKDSIKTHVSVSRDADGSGVMEIVDESLTDEPNGVEILIPVKRYSDFVSKANKFFRFWAPGTVLLNGKDPAIGLTKFSERIYIVDGASTYDDDVIVMGNVAYPVKGGLNGGDTIHKYNRKNVLAAYVTMNGPDEVVFTPSREGLNYTIQTTNVVNSLRNEYKAAVVKTIQDSMANAKSFGEAYKAFVAFERTYASSLLTGVTYAGHSMPVGYIKIPDPNSVLGATKVQRATVWSINRYRYAVATNSELSYEQIMSGMIITNYPSALGVSGTHKAKINAYRDDNSITTNHVILLPDAKIPGAPWTSDTLVVDWSEIKSIQLTQRNSNYASKSYGGGYDVYTPGAGYVLDHSLTAASEIIYYSKAQNQDSEYMPQKERDLITTWLPNAKIVECGTNRHDKLVRLFPLAMGRAAARSKIAKAVCDSLTPSEKEQIKIQTVRHLDFLDRIDYNSIDDPDLRHAVEVYRMKETSGTTAFRQIPQDARDKVIATIGAPVFKDVKDRYPLLTWDTNHKADRLIYINAKYASLKGI